MLLKTHIYTPSKKYSEYYLYMYILYSPFAYSWLPIYHLSWLSPVLHSIHLLIVIQSSCDDVFNYSLYLNLISSFLMCFRESSYYLLNIKNILSNPSNEKKISKKVSTDHLSKNFYWTYTFLSKQFKMSKEIPVFII